MIGGMNAYIRILGLALMGLASVAVHAEEIAPTATLRAEGGWIRAAPPDAPVRAGYLELINDGKRRVVLNKATSPAFGAVEIHEMRDIDGVARMRRVMQLELPPGQRVALAPGGLHLMLFRPNAPLDVGAVVDIELTGPDGVMLPARLVVKDEP